MESNETSFRISGNLSTREAAVVFRISASTMRRRCYKVGIVPSKHWSRGFGWNGESLLAAVETGTLPPPKEVSDARAWARGCRKRNAENELHLWNVMGFFKIGEQAVHIERAKHIDLLINEYQLDRVEFTQWAENYFTEWDAAEAARKAKWAARRDASRKLRHAEQPASNANI